MLPTILIVEAHTVLRQALRGWLEMTFPRYEISEAASGAEAIALTRTRAPDVVVIELSLPDMNGLEAMARLEVITPETPMVILTSCEVEKQYVQSRTKGTSTFVVINRVTELRSTLAPLLAPQRKLVES